MKEDIQDIQENFTFDTEPTIMFQILTGVSEDEYYTGSTPVFSSDGSELTCSNIIKKNTIKRQILNKSINKFYASDIIPEQIFKLKDGVLIKALDEKNEDLIWMHQTKETAEETLKDEELELYRKLLPKLLEKKQEVTSGGGRKFFIE